MTTRALIGHPVFSLCCPLVGVFTCFEFVYISFYFQISQEKIKPSLLTRSVVAKGCRYLSCCGLKHFHFNDISDSVAVSYQWYILRIVGSLMYCTIPTEVSANYLTYIKDCTLYKKNCLHWFVFFFFSDLQLVRWCIWGSVMLRCWQEQALYNAPLNACQQRTLLRNSPL